MPETGSIFKTPPEMVKNSSDCKNYRDKSQKDNKRDN